MNASRTGWSEGGSGGASLASGLYLWSFASLGTDGAIQRILDVPVRLEQTTVGSLALPPQPALLPESSPAGPALVRLGLGLGAAALCWIVTPAFTDRDLPRVALTVTFTAAGIIGFFEKWPGRPIPENVAANRAALATWQAQVERVNGADQDRRPGPRIVLETARPSVRR